MRIVSIEKSDAAACQTRSTEGRRLITVSLALAVCLLGMCLDLRPATAEKWTNLGGDRTVEATMVGMWDNQVVLVLADGRRINVPMDSLIAESRIQASKIATKLNQQRVALTGEIKKVAEAAAAPAPDPLPEPPAAPDYEPPAAGMSPEKTLQLISDQIQNGHVVVLYDALPPSYRQKIDALAKQTLTKLDPNALAQPLSQLHSLADLIVTRQNWILSHPRLQETAGQKGDLNTAGEVIEKLALPAANLVRAGLPADQAAIEAIEPVGFAWWLHQQDAAIAPYAAILMQAYSSPASQWSLVDSKEDTAILEKPGAFSTASGATSGPDSSESGSSDAYVDSSSGPPSSDPYSSDSYSSDPYSSGASNVAKNPTIALKKVEGFWIPASVAEGFDGWIAAQTAELEKFDDATMSPSAWLGGQFVAAPTAPIAPQRNDYGPGGSSSGSSSSSGGYDEDGYSSEMEYSDMEMYDTVESQNPYDSSGGYGSSGNAKPAALEPIAITPEMIGSVLQSVGAFSAMAAPLQSATDATSFHQAAELIIGSIEGMLSLIGGK